MKTISVITINLNNAVGLEKTLRSVYSQSDCGFEHVIIDGASTDGSAEIIKAYSGSARCRVKWLSEPDSGIYNAMNKGIRMAEGEYIQILNSGDTFASEDVIAKMKKSAVENGYPDILFGNMCRASENGTIISKSGRVDTSLLQFYAATLNHNCAWIKRCLFDDYGFYDESLKIVSDWKWYLQVIGMGGVVPVYVDIDVSIFDTVGISETNLKLRNEERRQVLEQCLPPAVLRDYDKYSFGMQQFDRLHKYHLYWLVYLIERVLFKLEKWRIFR